MKAPHFALPRTNHSFTPFDISWTKSYCFESVFDATVSIVSVPAAVTVTMFAEESIFFMNTIIPLQAPGVFAGGSVTVNPAIAAFARIAKSVVVMGVVEVTTLALVLTLPCTASVVLMQLVAMPKAALA